MVRKVTEAAEPIPLGGEVAGEVVRVGADLRGFRAGDRVTGLCFGHGYADYAVLQQAMASPIPAGASAVDAVALVRSGLVALGVLQAARPEKGEAVLVTAAASGVGHLAVQLARARGAGRVVGAVSDAAKADFVRALGADAVVRYGDDGWGGPGRLRPGRGRRRPAHPGGRRARTGRAAGGVQLGRRDDPGVRPCWWAAGR